MQRFTYQNFNVMFARTGKEGEYSASVSGTGGEGDVTFTLLDIQTALAENISVLDAPNDDATASRHLIFAPTVANKENYYFTIRRPPTYSEAQKLGGALFKSVFKETLRLSFEAQRRLLPDRKTHLRIRLHLTKVPELATLPWEYLYNADLGLFYAQGAGTPVIRYLDVAQPVEEPVVEEALRMLVVISSPSGAPPLDVEREWKNIQAALKPLGEQNLILEPLFKPTLEGLRKKLQTGSYHIFHFIGHGVFDKQSGEGSLIFENEKGEAQPVSGDLLGTNLRDQGLKLAVINACEGAVSAPTNAYTGIAQSLCRNSLIPAVLAMQFKIGDEAAITFATSFYEALANDYPIEAALAETRIAILNNMNIPNDMNKVEWATPVLYMRSDDGRIRGGANSSVVVMDKTPQTDKGGNISTAPALAEHYHAVIETLRDGQFVPFVGLDANLFGRASDPEKWERAAGLPGNAELARYLSRKFNYPLNDLPDLARIAQYSIFADRLGNLNDRILEIFANEEQMPTPTALHSTIAELAAKVSAEAKKKDSTFLRATYSQRKRFLVVTTGYDNLFEEAFKKSVGDFHVVSYTARGEQRGKFSHTEYSRINSPVLNYINIPNQYNGLANGNPVILKLPGTVGGNAPGFAITEDDYFDYLTNRELTNLLPAVITDKLKESNHLFLGYSPCSWNMRALLYRIWEERQRISREAWAVLSEKETMDEKFWKACSVSIIRADLSEYIEGLRAAAAAV